MSLSTWRIYDFQAFSSICRSKYAFKLHTLRFYRSQKHLFEHLLVVISRKFLKTIIFLHGIQMKLYFWTSTCIAAMCVYNRRNLDKRIFSKVVPLEFSVSFVVSISSILVCSRKEDFSLYVRINSVLQCFYIHMVACHEEVLLTIIVIIIHCAYYLSSYWLRAFWKKTQPTDNSKQTDCKLY